MRPRSALWRPKALPSHCSHQQACDLLSNACQRGLHERSQHGMAAYSASEPGSSRPRLRVRLLSPARHLALPRHAEAGLMCMIRPERTTPVNAVWAAKALQSPPRRSIVSA